MSSTLRYFNHFIYFLFQIACNVFFFKSTLFADQITQKLFQVTRKNQQGTETSYYFSPKIIKAYTFYCLNTKIV